MRLVGDVAGMVRERCSAVVSGWREGGREGAGAGGLRCRNEDWTGGMGRLEGLIRLVRSWGTLEVRASVWINKSMLGK
jgi:hypothetical protein